MSSIIPIVVHACFYSIHSVAYCYTTVSWKVIWRGAICSRTGTTWYQQWKEVNRAKPSREGSQHKISLNIKLIYCWQREMMRIYLHTEQGSEIWLKVLTGDTWTCMLRQGDNSPTVSYVNNIWIIKMQTHMNWHVEIIWLEGICHVAKRLEGVAPASLLKSKGNRRFTTFLRQNRRCEITLKSRN